MNSRELYEFRHKLNFIFQNFPKDKRSSFELWTDGIRHEISLERLCTYSFMYITNRCFDMDRLVFTERYAILPDYEIDKCVCIDGRWDDEETSVWNAHKLFHEENLIDYQDILTGLNLIMVEVL